MIGVLDWGIGGIGFVRELEQVCPGAAIRYLSDTGSTPYGKLSRAALAARVKNAIEQLRVLGAERIVVACNAASTTIVESDRLIGVVSHAIELARTAGVDARVIGVIGGHRTIRSGIYRKGLKRVKQRVAQPLSACIEAGDLDSAELDANLRKILRPLKGVDALLLACTHYPAISARIARFIPDVPLLDPAAAMAAWVVSHWHPARGASRFYTTGDVTAMRRAAKLAWGVGIESASRIEL
jgi:glutamate racemase